MHPRPISETPRPVGPGGGRGMGGAPPRQLTEQVGVHLHQTGRPPPPPSVPKMRLRFGPPPSPPRGRASPRPPWAGAAGPGPPPAVARTRIPDTLGAQEASSTTRRGTRPGTDLQPSYLPRAGVACAGGRDSRDGSRAPRERRGRARGHDRRGRRTAGHGRVGGARRGRDRPGDAAGSTESEESPPRPSHRAVGPVDQRPTRTNGGCSSTSWCTGGR